MIREIHRILKSPDSGRDLQYDEKERTLVDLESGNSYPFLEKVPVLLPENAKNIQADTEHHSRYHSEFLYADHYQTDAEAFDYFEAFEDGASLHEERRLHSTILRHIPESAQLILDVGCGNAWLAGALCPSGKTVISMDISTINPVKAIKTYPYNSHYGLVADVFHLPLKAGSVDIVVAAEIMEHVPDPKMFVFKLLEVLKPGGVLIITTPYNEKIAYSLCIHCNRPTPHHAHIHSFTEKNVQTLVPKALGTNLKAFGFSNKGLVKLQTHIILKYLPYTLWRLVDKMINSILPKPGRLFFRVEKR